MVLADLLNDCLGRIEEANPPVFWDLSGEVYVQMVDGEFEASLITGVVQANAVSVTLAANQTYFAIQGPNAVVDPGMLAAIRMRAPYGIRKTTLKALDDMQPNWQQATPGAQIQAWFPLGVSMFGIYPQMAAETQVTMDFIMSPVNEYRPYNGSEVIPFQAEFTDLLSKYAAALLRVKEGGAEAEEAETVYKDYLQAVKDLSLFQSRIDSLVYSSAYGAKSQVNPRTSV